MAGTTQSSMLNIPLRAFFAQRFELSRGGDAHNVRPMEGLRGLAVGLVFLVHYVTLVRPWVSSDTLLALSNAIHAIGNTGVDLFFVLSGYLIYGSLIARLQRFFTFIKRRVTRIYPAFLAVFALYLALSFVFPAERKIPAAPAEALPYLAANLLLLPGLFPIDPLITVAWSLSYEMFYYLSIPLVIAVCRLRDRSPAWRIWFFCALAAIGLACGAAFGGHVRLVMFVSGILLHEAHDARCLPAPAARHVGWLALVAGLLSPLLPLYGPAGAAAKAGILFLAFFLLCLACFREASAPLPRLFSWTPLRWLGNMSYSYYLLHGLALKAAFLLLARVLSPRDAAEGLVFWGLLPTMFVLTLIPSALLFLAIERPLSLAPAATVNGAGRRASQSR